MSRRRWYWALAIVAVGATAGVVGWWRGRRSAPVLAQCVLPLFADPCWSPDGEWVAIAVVDSETRHQWLGVVNRNQPGTRKWMRVSRMQFGFEKPGKMGTVAAFAWAAGGRQLVFEESSWGPGGLPIRPKGWVTVWTIHDGRTRHVGMPALTYVLSVSPDGALAALRSLTPNVTFLALDGKRRVVSSTPCPLGLSPVTGAWKQGDEHVVALGGVHSQGQMLLALPDKAAYTTLATGRALDSSRLAFDPDGTQIHFLDAAYYGENQYFGTVSTVDGTRQNLVAVSGLGIKSSVAYPDWSRDCTQAVAVGKTDKGRGVYLIDLVHATAKRLTDGPDDRTPSISPDGKRVLFTRGGNSVWVMNIDGSDQHPILQLGSATAPKPNP